MQKKILDEIDRIITGYGLESVQRSEWANTGTVHAQRGFLSPVIVRYQFNDTYCSIQITGPTVDQLVAKGDLVDSPPMYRVGRSMGAQHIDFPMLQYGEERIYTMLGLLTLLVKHAAMPKPESGSQVKEYVFHYRQTEYRRAAIAAASPSEALEKFRDGEYADEFVTTDDDVTVLAVSESQGDSDLCLWDAHTEFADMTNPTEAEMIYQTLRSYYLCERTGA